MTVTAPVPSHGSANLFADLPDALQGEVFDDILRSPNLRLERIVSQGQTTPDGQWYDQEQGEWVILLEGAARILFENETTERSLAPGDHLYIPPHCRHRVTYTATDCKTVWLALFLDGRCVTLV
jgi:cupin 2 domain-containing protein